MTWVKGIEDPARWRNRTYVFTTPGATPAQKAAERAMNLASLHRKITHVIKRPTMGIHPQRVEGMSSGEILDYMEKRGVDRERIERDIASGRAFRKGKG